MERANQPPIYQLEVTWFYDPRMRYYPTPEIGCDIVGRQEIADRLRVQPRTVSQWKWRGVLPEADFRLAGGDVWLWETIREWARKTDRLV